MSVLDLYFRSAQRRLDLLEEEIREEPWKAATREVEACRSVELFIRHIQEVFQLFREIDGLWRTAVYRGTDQPNDGRNAWVKGLFDLWLGLARTAEKTIIRFFEERGYEIDGAVDFRLAVADTERVLATWTPPLPARSPLMRVEDISEDEADALRAILDAPAGSPGKLKIAPLQMPEGDASMLR